MKIFVGNLPYRSTDTELNDAFSAHGEVMSAQVVTDRYTGRSRGFGFVEMPNDSEAEAAIAALNGKDMDGRALVVNQSRPREYDNSPDQSAGGRPDSGGSRW